MYCGDRLLTCVSEVQLLIQQYFSFRWHPTPVLLPGESQRQGSLVGFHVWDCKELDTTNATQCKHTFVKTLKYWKLTNYFFIEYPLLFSVVLGFQSWRLCQFPVAAMISYHKQLWTTGTYSLQKSTIIESAGLHLSEDYWGKFFRASSTFCGFLSSL